MVSEGGARRVGRRPAASRRRRRARRGPIGGLALLGGLALGAAQPNVSAAGLGGRAACVAASLRLRTGPPGPAATGEHAITVVIANVGRGACLLSGYPAVVVYAGGRPLPFAGREGGGPYVTARAPGLVRLAAGGRAAVLVAKYRCDTGDLVAGTTLGVWLPGVPTRIDLALPRPYGEGLVYCRSAAPGAPDPGNTITVSPVEPGVDAR